MRRPVFIARQGRHPHGWLGEIIGRIMAKETAVDNELAIALLQIESCDHIIDIGTGHGRSSGVMAAHADNGLVVGVDTSDVMLKIAAGRNKAFIDGGRIRLENASSDSLPFAERSFDKAMAMHTLYFWDPAEPHLREIARILKPGGHFVLGFRPAEDATVTAKFPDSVYTFRTTTQVEALLNATGFSIIGSKRRDAAGATMVWLLARKI
jgi:ubiquinone/menaquinone biosynthesis C-methylase UbiE